MFVRYTRERLLYYLVPLLMGVCGVLFAMGQADTLRRALVLLASLTVPLYAGGSLLIRYQTSLSVRTVMRIGILVGVLGVSATFAKLPDALVLTGKISPSYGLFLEDCAIAALFLGLFVVVYGVVRTGEGLANYGQRFWHLTEHLDEGFILTTRHGNIVSVNQRLLDLLRLKREDVLGKDVVAVQESLGIQNAREHWSARQRGMVTEYEVTVEIDGQERRLWARSTPIRDERGRHRATLATVRDVSDFHALRQREAEGARKLQELLDEQREKLSQSEEGFRQLLISMNQGFLTIDVSNRVRFANEHICRILRVQGHELVGQDLLQYVDVPDRSRFMGMLQQRERLSGGSARSEIRLVNNEGEPVPTVTAVAYIPGMGEAEGSPVHSLVVTDVGELKRMQRQLERRAQELELANEELRAHGKAKDAFLSNVSHELRTPLSTIQGYVEMLESGTLGALQGPQKGAIEVMDRNVKRITGHINEMIEFSRMEIRGVKVETILFSVERLLREAVASVLPQALSEEISIGVDVPRGMPHAWGDRGKLNQVLGNLLGNAVKFTGRGGQITVRAAQQAGHMLLLSVEDNGIGIDPAFQGQVFEKFFQVDSSKTRRYEGTGIGLSIARSIVEGHGGVIELRSAPGKGSCFTARLPHALFDTNYDTKATAGLEGILVLCVNSNQSFMEVVDRVLGSCGCTVEHVSGGGHTCVRRVEELQPDVVLINETGTEEHWRETAGLLRETSGTAFVPVVVFRHAGSEAEDPGTPFSGVVRAPKPFSAQILVDYVSRAFYHEFDEHQPEPADESAAREDERRATVLVVDSDPGLAEWAEVALGARGVNCRSAGNSEDALALTRERKPDVIFLDIDSAGNRAADYVRSFRQAQETNGAAICVMSGLPRDAVNIEGVSNVLHKPFSADDMLAVIKTTIHPSHVKV